MEKTIFMGEFDTVRSPDVLKTNLGSCVGVVLYDPQTDVFGLAHVMLPSGPNDVAHPGRYADTAIPALLQKMGTPLTETKRLKAKLAGGASMFEPLPQVPNVLNVGENNIEAVAALLTQLGITIIGTDLGGTVGRELTIDAQTGKIWVRSFGGEPKEF